MSRGPIWQNSGLLEETLSDMQNDEAPSNRAVVRIQAFAQINTQEVRTEGEAVGLVWALNSCEEHSAAQVLADFRRVKDWS